MKKMHLATDYEAFQVTCPKCGRQPRKDCWNGWKMRKTMHKERYQAAYEQKQARKNSENTSVTQ